VEEPSTDTEPTQHQVTPGGSPGKRPVPSSSTVAHIRLAASSSSGGEVRGQDESLQEGVSTSVLDESAGPPVSKKIKPSPIVWQHTTSTTPCEFTLQFKKWLFLCIINTLKCFDNQEQILQASFVLFIGLCFQLLQLQHPLRPPVNLNPEAEARVEGSSAQQRVPSPLLAGEVSAPRNKEQ